MATWNAGTDWDVLESEEDSGLNNLPDVRPARLLLAEDDDELRRSIAAQLRRKGYMVDEAFSGFEAIALIARQEDPYDLIISDLQLRGMTGLEIVDELRSSPRPADARVPVILLSQNASQETQRTAERLHAVLLEKPCDPVKLTQNAEQLARPVQIDHRPN